MAFVETVFFGCVASPLPQGEREDICLFRPDDEFAAHGTLGSLGFVGSAAVLAGDERFHQAGVAEEVTYKIH